MTEEIPPPNDAIRALFADGTPVIYVDFNARTEDDRVSLSTVESRRSLAQPPVAVGNRVWVFDGELRARATIEASDTGHLLARVDWDTAEDVEWIGREEWLKALIDKELSE